MLKMNPILKKDLKVSSRTIKFSLGLTAYEAIMMIILFIALQAITENSYYYSYGNRYDELVNIFPYLSIAQIVIVGLIIPIMTASSISGERERQTFDIMLTTNMTPFSIVLGKVVSAVSRVMLFVVASIPIMSISFILGGMKWITLLYFLIMITIYAFFSGSIGILCSSICKKSLSSIILAYCLNVLIYGGTFIPLYVAYVASGGRNGGESFLFLLFNPIIFFEEFYVWVITGSFSETLMNQIRNSEAGPITAVLSDGAAWLFASGIMIIVLTILLMKWSARRINPLKGKSFDAKVKTN